MKNKHLLKRYIYKFIVVMAITFFMSLLATKEVKAFIYKGFDYHTNENGGLTELEQYQASVINDLAILLEDVDIEDFFLFIVDQIESATTTLEIDDIYNNTVLRVDAFYLLVDEMLSLFETPFSSEQLDLFDQIVDELLYCNIVDLEDELEAGLTQLLNLYKTDILNDIIALSGDLPIADFVSEITLLITALETKEAVDELYLEATLKLFKAEEIFVLFIAVYGEELDEPEELLLKDLLEELTSSHIEDLEDTFNHMTLNIFNIYKEAKKDGMTNLLLLYPSYLLDILTQIDNALTKEVVDEILDIVYEKLTLIAELRSYYNIFYPDVIEDIVLDILINELLFSNDVVLEDQLEKLKEEILSLYKINVIVELETLIESSFNSYLLDMISVLDGLEIKEEIDVLYLQMLEKFSKMNDLKIYVDSLTLNPGMYLTLLYEEKIEAIYLFNVLEESLDFFINDAKVDLEVMYIKDEIYFILVDYIDDILEPTDYLLLTIENYILNISSDNIDILSLEAAGKIMLLTEERNYATSILGSFLETYPMLCEESVTIICDTAVMINEETEIAAIKPILFDVLDDIQEEITKIHRNNAITQISDYYEELDEPSALVTNIKTLFEQLINGLNDIAEIDLELAQAMHAMYVQQALDIDYLMNDFIELYFKYSEEQAYQYDEASLLLIDQIYEDISIALVIKKAMIRDATDALNNVGVIISANTIRKGINDNFTLSDDEAFGYIESNVSFTQGTKIDVILFEEIENEDKIYEWISDLKINKTFSSLDEEALQERLLKQSLIKMIDISLTDENNESVLLEDGLYTIYLLLPESLKDFDHLNILYLGAEDIEVFDVDIEGKWMSFQTNHLSVFYLSGSNNPEPTQPTEVTPTEPEPTIPEEVKNLHLWWYIIPVIIILIATAIIFNVQLIRYIKRK